MKRVFLLMASALFIVFSCSKPADKNKKDDEKTPEENPQEQTPEEQPTVSGITVDGQFDDWASLEGAAIAKNSSASQWDAVKELRVYATDHFVYYYVRFDKETITELLNANDILPARLNLNTDGEFASGYDSYFLQAYDFIIELSLGDGTGGWGSASDGSLHQRIDGSWKELLKGDSGLTYGFGSGNEFEICLDRDIFNKAANQSPVPMPMGDTFQTSMRFYETISTGKWEELSNIPNSDDGYGNLLEVTFVK